VPGSIAWPCSNVLLHHSHNVYVCGRNAHFCLCSEMSRLLLRVSASTAICSHQLFALPCHAACGPVILPNTKSKARHQDSCLCKSSTPQSMLIPCSDETCTLMCSSPFQGVWLSPPFFHSNLATSVEIGAVWPLKVLNPWEIHPHQLLQDQAIVNMPWHGQG